MFAAVIVGIVESVGDYYACARICGKFTLREFNKKGKINIKKKKMIFNNLRIK